MYRLVSIFLLGVMLVSVLSLSLQTAYKNYWCQDTKEYLSFAGKQITVCGKVCDFQFVHSQETDQEAHFAFNHTAPPLYFENSSLEIPADIFLLISDTWHPGDDHYHFDFASIEWQPPRS